MKRGFFSLLTGVLILTSCVAPEKDAGSLVPGRWNVTEVGGEKMNEENYPFIEFDVKEKRLHGNAGCNNFNASFKLDSLKPSSLTITRGMATLMACPDMEAEGLILASLDKIASVETGESASRLRLLDKSGEVVLLLERAE